MGNMKIASAATGGWRTGGAGAVQLGPAEAAPKLRHAFGTDARHRPLTAGHTTKAAD